MNRNFLVALIIIFSFFSCDKSSEINVEEELPLCWFSSIKRAGYDQVYPVTFNEEGKPISYSTGWYETFLTYPHENSVTTENYYQGEISSYDTYNIEDGKYVSIITTFPDSDKFIERKISYTGENIDIETWGNYIGATKQPAPYKLSINKIENLSNNEIISTQKYFVDPTEFNNPENYNYYHHYFIEESLSPFYFNPVYFSSDFGGLEGFLIKNNIILRHSIDGVDTVSFHYNYENYNEKQYPGKILFARKDEPMKLVMELEYNCQ